MKLDARRILAEKRAIILPVAVGLLANAAIYGLAVYPLTVKVRNAATRATQAAESLAVARRDAQTARAAETGEARAREELQRFYTQVLPADLAGARRITYLRLAQLADRNNLRSERRSAAPQTERSSTLGRLAITMVLQGDYADIRRFIYQLETAPEFVVIDDVSLAEGGEATSPLVLTLQLSAYYRNQSNGD